MLHEDRLAEGLAYLVRVRGLKCPAITIPANSDLDEIYDAEVEAATRDAYARDYMAFGFGDWRA